MTSAAMSDRRHAVDTAAVAIMIVLTFSWGMNAVAAKISYAGFEPVTVTVLRSVIGGGLVLAWCHWRRIPVFNRDGSLLAGSMAGLLFGLEFVALYIGLEHTTVAHNVLLVNTMPFWVLIGGHFLLNERITPSRLFGLILAFGGLVSVFWEQLVAGDGAALYGDVLSLLGGIFWALTYLLIKRSDSLNRGSAEKLLLYQLAGAAIIGLVVMPFMGPPVRELSMAPVLSLVFQSVYIVAFTYVLWFWVLRRYPASGLSSFTFLTPVFAVLCGAIMLGEPLTGRVFLALGLIATGLVIVNRPQRPGHKGAE